MTNEDESNQQKSNETMLNLGAWLGRNQAFGLIAARSSAAAAECMKAIKDAGEYKQLGITWDEVCTKYLGASRTYVEKQIRLFEEFGPGYHRFHEVMPISPETYRLIEASVADDGLQHNGERIAITRENRGRLSAAVNETRANTRKGGSAIGSLRKRLDVLLNDSTGAANQAHCRLELIAFLEDGSENLRRLAGAIREKTLVQK